MYYNLREPYPNELYHHGIKGQKWGVRRFQNPDGSYTDAGRKRYGIGVRTGEIDPELAGSLIGAAAVALVAVAPYAAAGIKRSNAKRFVNKCEKERAKAPIDSNTGLKLIKQQKSTKENLKRVNPKYHTTTDPSYHNNCPNCSLAFEMRNRGYEVQAKANPNGADSVTFFERCFKPKPTIKHIGDEHPGDRIAKKYNIETDDDLNELQNTDPKKFNDFQNDMRDAWADIYSSRKDNKKFLNKFHNMMSKEPKGSRGQMSLTWDPWSGHSISYEITSNGECILYDGQSGETYKGKEIDNLISNSLLCEFRRLDNLELNIDACKEEIR